MKGKKILGFLLLRPAFTRSNFTAFLLVALFVGIYSMAGGKVNPVPPNIQTGEMFGSVDGDFAGVPDGELEGLGANGADVPAEPVSEPVNNRADRREAQSIIGVRPSADEVARLREIDKRGRLFDPDTPEEDGEDGKPINREGLVQGVEIKSHREEWMMQRSEKRRADTLAAIEDRLDVKRARKKKFPVSTGDPN